METVTSRGVARMRENGTPRPRAMTRMRSVPLTYIRGVSHVAARGAHESGAGQRLSVGVVSVGVVACWAQRAAGQDFVGRLPAGGGRRQSVAGAAASTPRAPAPACGPPKARPNQAGPTPHM